MKETIIITPKDNIAVALKDLEQGHRLKIRGKDLIIAEKIPVKHKLALQDFSEGNTLIMYGVPVGVVVQPIKSGGLISTSNVKHTAADYEYKGRTYDYEALNISHLKNKTFEGYYRADGQVGSCNYWIFIPLVFCQNRNLQVLKEAFETELGFRQENPYKLQLRGLIKGELQAESEGGTSASFHRTFNNIDGIKFLSHEGGCGGTRDDAQALVNLLAGYIKNPNVAGATVLSLGCQHAQMSLLQEALVNRYKCDKPVLYFEQQQYKSEREMLSQIVGATFQELQKVNKLERQPASLSKLNIGLECGGSDGFSGITANPVIGMVADKIGALGGKSILSEFPELCGVEQDLIDRCESKEIADRFINLMEVYNTKAKGVGSGFDMNPSPGNIKDGLITDAIKSAGAATKGGRGTISDVLDYAEYATKPGLNLLCTPGNDVESTTGLAASGANIILFSTGLGTPTGNPVTPVIKISSNSMLPKRMNDIIDFDAGKMISEGASLDQLSEELIQLIIEIASGRKSTSANELGQDDFIPWKRGVSL